MYFISLQSQFYLSRLNNRARTSLDLQSFRVDSEWQLTLYFDFGGLHSFSSNSPFSCHTATPFESVEIALYVFECGGSDLGTLLPVLFDPPLYVLILFSGNTKTMLICTLVQTRGFVLTRRQALRAATSSRSPLARFSHHPSWLGLARCTEKMVVDPTEMPHSKK